MSEILKTNNYIPTTKIKQRRANFMSKVVARQLTVHDGVEPCFRSSLSVFMPKLTPKYAKQPTLMFHASNGRGSCLMRFINRELLIDTLQELINTLQSDKWIDAWERINDISQDLVQNGEAPFFDEEFMDVNAWNKALAQSVNVATVRQKEEFDTSTQKKYK